MKFFPFALAIFAALVSGACNQAETAVILQGSAVYPDGTPVQNRPFDAVVTIQGKGTPTCHYGTHSSSTKADQPVSGTAQTSLAFDGSGQFELQANTGWAQWSFEQDTCSGYDSDWNGLSDITVNLDTVEVVRIDAGITVSTEVCSEYCTSYSNNYCTQYCQAHADDASCLTTCGTQTWQTCGTQCSSAKKVIASATAYGTDAKTDSKTGYPILNFSFKFSGLQ